MKLLLLLLTTLGASLSLVIYDCKLVSGTTKEPGCHEATYIGTSRLDQ